MFHICVNTSTPEEGFSGLIERVTLGNSAPGNRVGEGRVGDRARASFVRAAILYENPLADVMGSKHFLARIKSGSPMGKQDP